MNDGDALLAAIVAQPDEDTPRLVYADYLDERGGGWNTARAEFIRLQVANVNVPGTYWELKGTWRRITRFADLLAVQPWTEPKVMAELRKESGYVQPSNSTSGVLWRRGFIEGVLCSGHALAASFGDLARHPLREVRLTGEPPEWFLQKLYPGWKHGNIYAYSEERPDLLKKALFGPGSFPHLLHAVFDYQRPGTKTCPFEVIKPRTPEPAPATMPSVDLVNQPSQRWDTL